MGSNLIAQSPYAIHFNEFNGLPSNAIYAAFQDSKGYIWTAGDYGLAKYNGKKWQTFKAENQNQQSGSCIQEDRLGRIWYENFDGYLFFSRKKNGPYSLTQVSLTRMGEGLVLFRSPLEEPKVTSEKFRWENFRSSPQGDSVMSDKIKLLESSK